jgi:hypothetical protein
MPAFTYEALVPGGGRTRGTLEAKSRQEALAQLSRQRLQPIRLQLEGAAGPAAKAAGPGAVAPAERQMNEGQIISFTEELGDLLDAGLQLEGALKMMEQRSEASALKAVAESLRTQVREGVSLSRALKTASSSFSDLYCNLVAAGEVSGALGPILQRQVLYLKKLSDLKGRVVQALIYPMFVTGAGILLMGLFVVVLVPQLEMLFKTQKPPLITQLLLGTSRFLVQWGWMVLVMVGGSFVYAGGCTLNDAFDERWDREHRPGRLIPSGRVTARFVWVSGLVEMISGVVLMAMGAALVLGLASLAVPDVAETLLLRSGEFSQPGTSGHERFVTPFMMMRDVFDAAPWAAFAGIGPGTAEFLELPYKYWVNTPAKLITEYGLVGFGLYLALIISARRSAGQRILVLPVLVLLLLTGGYHQAAPLLFPMLLLITVARLEEARPGGR